MKKVYLFFIGFLLYNSSVLAQSGEGGYEFKNISPEVRAERVVKRMTKELSLNEEQKEKIKTLHLEMMSSNKASSIRGRNRDEVFRNAGLEGKESKDTEEVMEAYDAKLKEILTPEQYAIYKKNEEEKGNNGRRK